MLYTVVLVKYQYICQQVLMPHSQLESGVFQQSVKWLSPVKRKRNSWNAYSEEVSSRRLNVSLEGTCQETNTKLTFGTASLLEIPGISTTVI